MFSLPQLMDLMLACFHQPTTRSRLGSEADGFPDWLHPSAATRKLFSSRS